MNMSSNIMLMNSKHMNLNQNPMLLNPTLLFFGFRRLTLG